MGKKKAKLHLIDFKAPGLHLETRCGKKVGPWVHNYEFATCRKCLRELLDSMTQEFTSRNRSFTTKMAEMEANLTLTKEKLDTLTREKDESKITVTVDSVAGYSGVTHHGTWGTSGQNGSLCGDVAKGDKLSPFRGPRHVNCWDCRNILDERDWNNAVAALQSAHQNKKVTAEHVNQLVTTLQ